MGKKTNFEPDFGLNGPNLAPQFFFFFFSDGFYLHQMLNIITSYHRMQLQEKLMIQTQENGKKPHSGPDLGPLGPNLGCQIFFFKNLAVSVTRYHGQLSSCTISEKTNDPILRKVNDGQMDRQADRQMDESDFMGCCPTNIKCPIIEY